MCWPNLGENYFLTSFLCDNVALDTVIIPAQWEGPHLGDVRKEKNKY